MLRRRVKNREGTCEGSVLSNELTSIRESKLSADYGGFSVIPQTVGTHSAPGASNTQLHSSSICTVASYQPHLSIGTVGRGICGGQLCVIVEHHLYSIISHSYERVHSAGIPTKSVYAALCSVLPTVVRGGHFGHH